MLARMKARRVARLAVKAPPVATEDMFVTLTAHVGPAMRAINAAAAAVMFGWHPDLQDPSA